VTNILSLILVNLVTPEAGTKPVFLFNKLRLVCWTQFVKQKLMHSSNFRCYLSHNYQRYYLGHTLLRYLSLTWTLSKPTSEMLLYKSSCVAAALGVTEFVPIIYMYLVTLFVLLKSDIDVKQTHLRPQRPVCWISKSDLSSTTKCDLTHIYDWFEFGHT
jgi:hypothetical protein